MSRRDCRLGLQSLKVSTALPVGGAVGGLEQLRQATLLSERTAEKLSSGAVRGLLTRLFRNNRAVIAGGRRDTDVARREFLKQMRRGAIANSPLGALDAISQKELIEAAVRATAVQKSLSAAPAMTRRQALTRIPVAAAGYASAGAKGVSALAPAFSSSPVVGALRAVGDVNPSSLVAHGLGPAAVELRAKGRAAVAVKNLVEDPVSLDTLDDLARAARGAPDAATAVAKSILTGV